MKIRKCSRRNYEQDLKNGFRNIVKPVYNDHPRDPTFVAIVERWSLFSCSFMLQNMILESQKVVTVDKWFYS